MDLQARREGGEEGAGG
uniref:Uncharacterized protein n=1 Tax=Arundo donax TaxID=35708 RepID=A0A0A8YUR8_ARUDO